MPNFGDILVKTAESIDRPPLPPKGTYVLAVTKAPAPQERKGFEVLDFPMKAIRPTEDVDAAELKAYGSPNNIIVRKSFLFNTQDDAAFAQTEFNLRNFLVEHLGLPGDLTIKELLTMSVGKQCLGYIDYRPNPENPEIIYTDLKRTAPLEA